MTIIIYLIPVALALGGLGLAAFIWAARSGQFDDPAGAAHRILLDDDDRPLSGEAFAEPETLDSRKHNQRNPL
jgi:cbb3-type cytochrome oxidase maturation protein